LAALGTMMLLARLLTPAAYGLYATVVTIATFGQTAGFFWLQSSLLRLHAAARDENDIVRLGTAVWWGYVVATALISASWLVGVVVTRRTSTASTTAWLGLVLLLARSWVAISQAENRIRSRTARYAITDLVQNGGGGLLAALAAYTWQGSAGPNGGANAPLLGLTAGALLAALVSPGLLRHATLRRAPQWTAIADLLRYGGPTTLTSLAATALASSDRLLIAALRGVGDVGVYAMAYTLADRAVTLVLSGITLATKPLVFREFETHGAPRAHDLLRRVAALLMAVAFPIVTMLVAAPMPIATLVVGRGTASRVAAILPWVALASLLGGLTTLHFSQGLQLARRPWATFVAFAPAAAINIAANVLLLPRFGVVAAAWTTLLGYTVALGLTVRLTSRELRTPFPAADAARTVAACIPVGILLRVVATTTTFGAVLLLVSATAVYAFGALALDVARIRTRPA
jgi:O-antigen/teichoic acid export membrane protein